MRVPAPLRADGLRLLCRSPAPRSASRDHDHGCADEEHHAQCPTADHEGAVSCCPCSTVRDLCWIGAGLGLCTSCGQDSGESCVDVKAGDRVGVGHLLEPACHVTGGEIGKVRPHKGSSTGDMRSRQRGSGAEEVSVTLDTNADDCVAGGREIRSECVRSGFWPGAGRAKVHHGHHLGNLSRPVSSWSCVRPAICALRSNIGCRGSYDQCIPADGIRDCVSQLLSVPCQNLADVYDTGPTVSGGPNPLGNLLHAGITLGVRSAQGEYLSTRGHAGDGCAARGRCGDQPSDKASVPHTILTGIANNIDPALQRGCSWGYTCINHGHRDAAAPRQLPRSGQLQRLVGPRVQFSHLGGCGGADIVRRHAQAQRWQRHWLAVSGSGQGGHQGEQSGNRRKAHGATTTVVRHGADDMGSDGDAGQSLAPSDIQEGQACHGKF